MGAGLHARILARKRADTMKYGQTKIAPGGLMRCCTGTLHEWLEIHQHDPVQEGKILKCDWCSEQMVLKGGVWRWANAGRRETVPG